MEGYVKISRSLLDSFIFSNPYALKIWVWMMLKAAHKPIVVSLKTGRGFTSVALERGQLIFGRNSAENQLNIDSSMISRVVKSFQQFEKITIKSNNLFSIITICDYDSYGEMENLVEQPTNSQRTANEQPTNTNNNDKNDKKDNKPLLPIGNKVVGLPSATQPKPENDKSVPYAERCRRFIEKFNAIKVVNGKPSKYQVTDGVKTKLKLRLAKYSSTQIIAALETALKDPHHIEDNFIYITPEFILRENIIERYLNASFNKPGQVIPMVYTPPTQQPNAQLYEA